MTIIHLTSTLGGGGAEQMVLQLAKKSNTTYKTLVISLSSKLTTLEKRFKKNNIKYHLIGVNSFKNSSLTKGLIKFKGITNKETNIVIHCHMYHAILFGIIYKLQYPQTRLIFTLHSNKLELRSRRLILFFSKSLRYKDIIFSNSGKKWYLKSNYEIIPNGVDFNYFNTKQKTNFPNKFTFLFIGRISHEKSPLRLVKAAQQLLEQGITNFVINFVGDGVLKDELIKCIYEKKIENYFNLYGFQQDIRPYLSHANCLLLPSLWEGLPVVIIEAAASQLPIISTPVGSIPDFLNFNNSYLSELETFDKTMLHVMENYDEALYKAELLYKEIKSTFDIKNVYKEHLKLYKLSLLQ